LVFSAWVNSCVLQFRKLAKFRNIFFSLE
jgi:hypothetical protein